MSQVFIRGSCACKQRIADLRIRFIDVIWQQHPCNASAYPERMPDLRDISLTQLVYFARCAELSSMTEAAAALHVAQSAVSTSIGNLEHRLGTPLFVRRRAK